MRTLIRDAVVVDGTGAERYPADVLVEGDLIAAIGAIPPDDARPVIASSTRPDWCSRPASSTCTPTPTCRSSPHRTTTPRSAKGVTTEVLGQDGLSYAPVDDDAAGAVCARQIAGWNGDPPDFDFAWRTVGEYLDRLDAGHRASTRPTWSRRAPCARWSWAATTGRPRPPRSTRMQEWSPRVCAQGAVGMSSGLTYTPGCTPTTPNSPRCAGSSPTLGGFYCPHHRSYGAGALDAYAEMIDLARASGCAAAPRPRHHELRAEPRPGGGAARPARRGAGRRRRHQPGHLPLPARRTTLSAMLPSWCRPAARTRPSPAADPAALDRIREDVEVNGSDGCHGVVAEWDTIEISGVDAAGAGRHVGRTIASIAAERGARPVRGLRGLLRRDRLGTAILQHVGRRGQRAGDHAPPRAHRRQRRHPGRRQAASAGLGHLPALPGALRRDLGLLTLEEMRRPPHRPGRRPAQAAPTAA